MKHTYLETIDIQLFIKMLHKKKCFCFNYHISTNLSCHLCIISPIFLHQLIFLFLLIASFFNSFIDFRIYFLDYFPF